MQVRAAEPLVRMPAQQDRAETGRREKGGHLFFRAPARVESCRRDGLLSRQDRENPKAWVPKTAPMFIPSAAFLISSGTSPQKKNGPGTAISASFGKC